jgi:hypothetical protein
MDTEDFQIRFGTTEKESPDDYNNLTVGLILKATGNEVGASVDCIIEKGTPRGQFDTEREHIFYTLSISEVETLIAKLQEFVATGKEFLDKYSKK